MQKCGQNFLTFSSINLQSDLIFLENEVYSNQSYEELEADFTHRICCFAMLK